MSLAENLETFQKVLEGTSCRLVAVSKTKPIAVLQDAYDLGIRVFGENKVQELTEKYEALPKDIEWHMIGHLQRNKVKYIVPFVALIHSVDSVRLLQEINKRAANVGRVVNCLLQVHIAQEKTKFGFDEAELETLLTEEALAAFTHVRLKGLMGMATNTDDPAQVRQEFRGLKTLFERCKAKANHYQNVDFTELSMGMSNDYTIALEEGSTLIRVGSSIFGARGY